MMRVELKYHGRGRLSALNSVDMKVLEEQLQQGATVVFTEDKERSSKQHRWLFACIRKAFETLPEKQIPRFPTAEHLRKGALIKAGWCDIHQQAFSSAKVADLAAKSFKLGVNLTTGGKNYTLAIANDNVVTYAVPRSISFKACRGPDWEAVCIGVINYLSELVECDVTELLDGIQDIPTWVTEEIRR